MIDKYDTFWRRFFAGLLDAIVLSPVGFVIIITFTGNVFSLVLGTILMHSIGYAYSVFFHYHSGQTYGKKWMNLRVVSEDEKQLLTFEQSFKRDSIPIFLEAIGVLFICAQIIEFGEMPAKKSILRQMIDWLGTVWFLLEIVTMMMNEKRRALHDLLAGSVVIKDEYWTDKESRFQ